MAKGNAILLGAVLAASAFTPVWAEDASDAPMPPDKVERKAPQSATIAISAGRAIDLIGSSRYADRTAVSTTGSIVRFSARPISQVVSVTSGHTNRALSAPLSFSRKSSAFGYRRHPLSGGWRMHSGVDLAASMYTPVKSSAGGVVRRAGWAGGYGLLVEIDHGAGMVTRYGHLSRVDVGVGQSVAAGQELGLVGSTGNSTGAHLHFEKRIGGVAVDPGF